MTLRCMAEPKPGIADRIAIKTSTCKRCIETAKITIPKHVQSERDLVELIKNSSIDCGWREGKDCYPEVRK